MSVAGERPVISQSIQMSGSVEGRVDILLWGRGGFGGSGWREEMRIWCIAGRENRGRRERGWSRRGGGICLSVEDAMAVLLWSDR